MSEVDIARRMLDQSSMLTNTDKLVVRKEGSFGFLIFDNPARRNALTLDMWQGIPAIVEAFEADREVRVVIVAGAGDAAFVSGADISQFDAQRANPAAEERYSAITDAAMRALEQLAKPSIAMIRGFCIGGGLAIALSCDLRITAEDGKFGIPAARLGLGYSFEGVRKLVDVCGPAYAKEILFTARQFDAEDALRMGLVNMIVGSSELENAVRAYAEQIAHNAPLTVRASKLAVGEALKDPERRDMDAVEEAIAACFDSADFAEGRRAFADKRRPRFQGR